MFFYQITRPTSFLSAILQVEYSRLLPPEKGKPRADGGPTWETVYQQYQERLRKEPVTQRHFAVSDLLDAVVDVERGRRSAAEVVGKMQSRFAVDGDNAISRLAYGALVDAGATGKSATERFDEWRRIVEQPGPAKVSALYNKEYDDVFSDVLSGYIKRLDVRANLVKYMDHFLVTDHYAALPMIQTRLSGLADELHAAGKATEAETCRPWVVRACLGLMEYEPDAGTRLLCADLAARCLPAKDEVRRDLLALRSDYHDKLSKSVPDLTSLSRSFVQTPAYYQSMLRRYFGAASLAMTGIGAGTLAMVLLLTSLVRKRSFIVDTASRPIRSWVTFGLLSTVVLIAFLGGRQASDPHSESCIYGRLLALIGIGFMAPMAISRLPFTGRGVSTVRFLACVIILVTLFLIVSMQAESLAWTNRFLDLRGGALVYESLLIVLGVIACAPWRSYSQAWLSATRAAGLWLTCMVFAIGGGILGYAIDIDFRFSLSRARVDGLTYILGDRWQIRYSLPHSASSYDFPTTSATP